MKLLLLSNSRMPGMAFLAHALEPITEVLTGLDSLLFVPHALADHAGYASTVREAMSAAGVRVESLHEARDPVEAVRAARSLFIGGGNTFRLLTELYGMDLVSLIHQRVRGGVPYIGSSAGTNVACVTIQTTNDMPIVEPPSFNALGLVPFNINPHYLDPNPDSSHQGETREQRIREFHEMNDRPGAGIREGSWLRIDSTRVLLGGLAGARLFRKDQEPTEHRPGEELDLLDLPSLHDSP